MKLIWAFLCRPHGLMVKKHTFWASIKNFMFFLGSRGNAPSWQS